MHKRRRPIAATATTWSAPPVPRSGFARAAAVRPRTDDVRRTVGLAAQPEQVLGVGSLVTRFVLARQIASPKPRRQRADAELPSSIAGGSWTAGR